MKTKKEIKGYKVTDENMQCRGYQYELNKVYKHDGSISLCNRGFHYCEIAADCFGYYTFKSSNRVFEVIDRGNTISEGDKNCTDNIEFVRELTWQEVLVIVNTGKDNTGLKNSGNSNSGNRNSGNSNSGNRNSGYRNSGDRNSGNRNSGNSNSGDRNSGDSNSGYRNSGDWNSGDRNSGDSNSGYRNGGAFCTDPNPKLILFDKESSMTVKEWETHPACEILYNLNPNIWVYASEMSEEEKKSNPKYKTTDGYLKSIPIKEAWSNMWHNLSNDKKKIITSLENFDKKKFFEITGIKL